MLSADTNAERLHHTRTRIHVALTFMVTTFAPIAIVATLRDFDSLDDDILLHKIRGNASPDSVISGLL